MENGVNVDIAVVFVIVYDGNKVFITDVKSEVIDCTKHLINSLIPFKVVVYNTVSDYIVRA